LWGESGGKSKRRAAAAEKRMARRMWFEMLLYFEYYRNMEIKDAVLALSALAQESRLAVFRLLVQAGPSGLPAGKIAETLGIPSSSLSFHLKELSRAGLSASRQESRFLIYSANFAAMNQLVAYLAENCCGGEPCPSVCSACDEDS
jgi:DNA-binding transcriptional ArsR family regulator